MNSVKYNCSFLLLLRIIRRITVFYAVPLKAASSFIIYGKASIPYWVLWGINLERALKIRFYSSDKCILKIQLSWAGRLNEFKTIGAYPEISVSKNLYVIMWNYLYVKMLCYRDDDKFLARPTSRCFFFDGENISFDASLVLYIYIYITNIPPIMIINMMYEYQILLSL